MNIIDTAAAICCCIMATGDLNRLSILTTMKDEIETCSGDATKKSTRQIVGSRLRRAVTRAWLNLFKASFRFACAAS